MGNIEIRDQQNAKRRTHIFTDRKSYDAARSQYRKSLTHRYDKSHYSPIRFSKISDTPKDMPLTQRKPNTLPEHFNNQSSYSPILNQQSLENSKSPTHRELFSKPSKLKNIEIQQNQEQQNQPSQKTGKIVSNSNKRVQQQRRSFVAFKEIMNKDQPLNSPLQTKQIIKKVRNFNDFLNEIKRKLKEDKQQTLLRNKSRLEEFNRNHPSQQKLNLTQYAKISPLKQTIEQSQNNQNLQKSRSMRRIEVALKLENQKIELEKYRKLVERQLSKTHSIQNISLCTKNSGEKILTIQYESLLTQNIFQPDHSNKSLNKQPSEKTLINKILQSEVTHQRFQQNQYHQNQVEIQKKPVLPQKDQSPLLKRLKQQYRKMLQNVLDLGKTIERYQMNSSMAESQVIDNKILIQQVSRFTKKSSQINQRQLSQKGSNFSKHSGQYHNEQTELRQKQSQSKVTENRFRETEKQSRIKQSQASKKSTQNKIAQFNKAQSQCSNKAGSQQSIKGSQKSERVVQIKNQQDLRKLDEIGIKDESHQFEKETYHFEKEESRASKAGSLSSKKQTKMEKKRSEEMSQQPENDNQNFQMIKKGSQASHKKSQASNRSSRKLNQNHQSSHQINQSYQQNQQEVSFANQSEDSHVFSYPLSSNPANQPKQLHPKDSKQKIERIESLFEKLNDLQSEYQETDREVREAIGEESEWKSQIEQDSSVN